MLVLDDARIGNLRIGIVHHRHSLVVARTEHLCLKPHGAVFEMSQTMVKPCVNSACVENPVGQRKQLVSVLQEVDARAHLNASQQSVGQTIVAAHGNALPGVVEVVIVEGETQGQAAYDEGGKLRAGSSPLLLGISLDEPLEDIPAHQQQCLLLQILRLAALQTAAHFGPLLFDACTSLIGSGHTPHPGERVHIEGKVVELSPPVGHRAVGVAVAGCQAVDKPPHALVSRVQDVRSILMHIDASHLLAMDIAACVLPALHHQTALACLGGQMGKGGSHQSGAYNQIVILPFHLFLWVYNGAGSGLPRQS